MTATKTINPQGRKVERANSGDTYALAEWLSENLSILSNMSNDELADALGYKRGNIISMWKLGKTRIPLNKLSAIARYTNTDLARLLPLWIEQYVERRETNWADPTNANHGKVYDGKEVLETVSRVVSKVEMDAVKAMRSAQSGSTTELTEAQIEAIKLVAANDANASKVIKALRGK